jgi:type I restriction enzyme M protein
VCLWFLSKNRAGKGHRDRKGEVLFIDARKLGYMATRTLRTLSPEDSTRISSTYHNWRNAEPEERYEDIAGFCKSASFEEIAKHDYVLTPGRYAGAADAEDDGEPIEEKLNRLRTQLLAEFEEADRLELVIRTRLEGLVSGE